MFNEKQLLEELKFKAIRSSGSGGQHVNKVSSKVEITFNLYESLVFNESQTEILKTKLQNRLTKNGLLVVFCDESRSQHKNKEIATKRLLELLKSALIIRKKRVPTKISKSAIQKRLKCKKIRSLKKVNRRKPKLD
ncbi:alternative ribosome rescue aminoacyl-tRNA hydrolase ArfB [Cognatitamlana onchidii]|uniref:alternative ribosome rescue aminoacyl-tRNA hydrolase ArfB n=1 Tax=Cognatitamlana onchidii TaxID=2562860 RepID=UPI0010A68B20|nr:alternative ribosome rescue aminoacyl-tRNA hydrolase ArfB [Algibacter onchidii]